MTERAAGEILGGVARLQGVEAGRTLARRGLRHLHEVMGPGEVGLLRDEVMERLRPDLLALSVAIGREFLGWDGDFFVDDYLVLRVYFPYEIARRADPSAENPGIGRLTPRVRERFRARKTLDPVFDPRGHHRDHPPAAWANGAHRDSWTGHSRGGQNIWWALDDVPAEAGILFYPERSAQPLRCDPRTFYLEAGFPLPPPTGVDLEAGDLLLFDGDLLHGTHLNTTALTRVALSMRISASLPTFDPACFFAREFWRGARDIEAGRDEILFLPREEHLGPPAAEAEPPVGLPVLKGAWDGATGLIRVALGPAEGARRFRVEAAPWRILVVMLEDGPRALDAACPHYGLDLADGGSEGDQLHCPGCGVAFDLRTGRSACDSLRLGLHDAWEEGGDLLVRVAP